MAMKILLQSRVVGSKKPFLDRHGVILGLEGTGHGRRWRVQWDNDDGIDLVHARSLILETPPIDEAEENNEDESGQENRSITEDQSSLAVDSDSDYSDSILGSEDPDENSSRYCEFWEK